MGACRVRSIARASALGRRETKARTNGRHLGTSSAGQYEHLREHISSISITADPQTRLEEMSFRGSSKPDIHITNDAEALTLDSGQLLNHVRSSNIYLDAESTIMAAAVPGSRIPSWSWVEESPKTITPLNPGYCLHASAPSLLLSSESTAIGNQLRLGMTSAHNRSSLPSSPSPEILRLQRRV